MKQENCKKVYVLKLDGVEVGQYADYIEIMARIHNQHSFSLSHALKYEGYSVEERAIEQ